MVEALLQRDDAGYLAGVQASPLSLPLMRSEEQKLVLCVARSYPGSADRCSARGFDLIVDVTGIHMRFGQPASRHEADQWVGGELVAFPSSATNSSPQKIFLLQRRLSETRGQRHIDAARLRSHPPSAYQTGVAAGAP